MIKSLIIIIIIGITSFSYTNIESNSVFLSVALPILFFISLVALAIWFVAFFNKNNISQTTDSRGSDSGGLGGFDGGGNGDGGG
jgi:uncharacterized membrane protein YgcG